MNYPTYPNYYQMYQQRPEPPQNPTLGISPASRMVASRQEAEAVPADFSGSPMVFPDATNNRVYIKRWNLQTGMAFFDVYAPEVTKPKPEPVAFVTMDEFAELKAEVEKLRKPARKKVTEDDDE